MSNLIIVREQIKKIYGKYESYIRPLAKLILSFVVLQSINAKLGYMVQIDNVAIVLIIALICSFMPVNFIVMSASGIIVLHFYAISMEMAAVAIGIFLIMFLLYFRFSPEDSLAALMTPLLFGINIPYIIPVAVGLMGNPAGAVAVACGTIVYYMIKFVIDNMKAFRALEAETAIVRFRFLIDGLIDNKAMIITVIAFMVTVIVVYVIRRLSIDRAWLIASISGALADIVILMVGDLIFDLNYSIIGIAIGGILAVGVAMALQFFFFNVDYNRSEKVQFEDDEYYYYVKAIPKIAIATPDKKVKQISVQNRQRATKQSVSNAVMNDNVSGAATDRDRVVKRVRRSEVKSKDPI